MADKRAKACLILIANEVLEGRTKDKYVELFTNHLLDRGIWLDEVRIIPDVKERIASAVRDCKDKFNYVFTTGGLGPTIDDITTESIAAAFDPPLVLVTDADTAAKHAAYYANTNRPYNADRQKMAIIPQGATIIPNDKGVAPGFIYQNIYAFPGRFQETPDMLINLKPTLQGGPIAIKSIFVIAPEGDINEGLKRVKKTCPDVIIGSYPDNNPATGRMVTEVKFRHTDGAQVDAAYAEMMKFITAQAFTLTEKRTVDDKSQAAKR